MEDTNNSTLEVPEQELKKEITPELTLTLEPKKEITPELTLEPEPAQEQAATLIFDGIDQVSFYIYNGPGPLPTTGDLIAIKKGETPEHFIKCTISFDDEKSFRVLAEEKFAKIGLTAPTSVTFKIVALYENEGILGVDDSNLRLQYQRLFSYPDFCMRMREMRRQFENDIVIIAVPWSLRADKFDWKAPVESYHGYTIIPLRAPVGSYRGHDIIARRAQSVIAWVYEHDIKYNILCRLLIDRDKTLTSREADQHIQEIRTNMMQLYHALKIWVVPTLASIHFILHLLKLHGVSDILAIGVGHGLSECILANEAKKIGQPLTIHASDVVFSEEWNELHKNTEVTNSHSAAPDTYMGRYYQEPIDVSLAGVAVSSFNCTTQTLFVMLCRATKFSVDVLIEFQRCHPERNITIAAFTTGEECVGTDDQCEPLRFYELAREYGYNITKYTERVVHFKSLNQNNLEDMLSGTVLGCKDYLMILQRNPVRPSTEEFAEHESSI